MQIVKETKDLSTKEVYRAMTIFYLIPFTFWKLGFIASCLVCCKVSSFETSKPHLNSNRDGIHTSKFVNEANHHHDERLLQSATVLLPFQMNCGNTTTTYTDPSTNKVWATDQYFTGTSVWNGCPEAVRLGFNLASHLCQTRQRSSFEYRIPVPYNGTYKVTLYFVETLRTASSTRIFNVRAEGITILSRLDVFAITGGRMRPYVRTFMLNVNDGFLTLRLSATTDRAMISAIEIEDGRPPTNMPTIKPTFKPISVPTRQPTSKPASMPTRQPTSRPTSIPTRRPTSKPTSSPTRKPTSKPTSAPAPKPTVPTQLQPTLALSTVRINCGGPAPFLDPLTNNTWSADTNFQNGSRYNACPAEIFNTTIDTVFCSERWFGGGTGMNGTYTIPVVPGMYTVRLLFAELFFNSPGSRVFNIYLQNRLVRRNLDIRAVTGGRNISLIIPFKATAMSTDPNVKVTLQTVAQNAKISGIEIIPYDGSVTDMPTSQPTFRPTRAPTNVFETILINCGYYLPFTDSLAREYSPDQFFDGGATVSSIVPIGNTVDDTLFQYDRVGDTFTYEIPVPVGSFAISLLFSENEYNSTGKRLFDVDIESQTIANVDIFQLAGGAFRASQLNVFQVVEDNFLSIQFRRSAQFPNAGLPKVSAIEVELDQPHIAHAVATGPYFGTVVNPVVNKAEVQLVGQTSHTHGDGQSLTNFTWKEGNTVLGTTVNTNYSFGVGLHTISLEVKDSAGSTNTEVTSVTINPFGFPAIASFIPSSGNLTGQYPVIIVGSGFNYTVNQITVMFGTLELTGSSITIINQTAIQVLAPANVVAQATAVTVRTPIGTSIPSFFNYVGSIPIQWQEIKLLDFFQPTVGRFGPDRKLYVGTRRGRILKITMNSDFTTVINSIVSFVNPDNEESIMGLTLDPMDVKSDPDVYFTMNRFFHRGNQSSSGRTVSGRIRRASGPNLETVIDIITGLPTSDLDHGLNGIEFSDNGALYFTSGSHTNGGIPGPLSSSRILKENFLSAAVNVAYLSHPNFNGNILWSAPDDGNMIAQGVDVFAAGLRNPYSVLLHTNGRLYSTDNGPNVDYGPMSIGCNGESIVDQKRDDEINLLEQGKYYGSPNLKRASFFNDARQCVWRGPEQPDTVNHTAPLITHQSSIDGLMEFHGNHFGGQLRYNLIYIRYNGVSNIHRVVLTSDGSKILPSLQGRGLAMNIGNLGLDITQAPNGNLVEMRYGNSSVYTFAPVEPATTLLIAKTCFPRRGPTSGGNTLSIYGVNLNTRSPNVTVTVGGINCPTTFVSLTQVDCTLPGGSGTVDIVVRNGVASSTFERGYRYISGTLPLGFVLPIYTG